MTCPHCNSLNAAFVPFTHPVEGGRAYAQTCARCGRVLGIRPRVEGDPAPLPDFSAPEIARLQFVRWRLAADCTAQIRHTGFGDMPSHAA